MELDSIKTTTTWNDAATSINNNNSKIKDTIEKLMQGGGGGGIANIEITTDAPAYLTVSANQTQDGVKLQVNPTIPTSIDSEESGFASVKAVREWSDNKLLTREFGGYPKANNTADLGSPTNQWKSVYATDFYEDGCSLEDKYMPINAHSTTPRLQEYAWRASTDGEVVTDVIASVNKIYGNTVRWHQLFNRLTTVTSANITVSFDTETNEVVVKNNERTSNLQNTTVFGQIGETNIVKENKYLLTSTHAWAGLGLVIGRNTSYYHAVNTVFTAEQSSAVQLALTSALSIGSSNTSILQSGLERRIKLCLFDLTEMFGEGNEPASYGEWLKLYPEPYYAPSTTKIVGTKLSSIDTPTYNLWDKTKAVAGIYHYQAGDFRDSEYHKQRWVSYIVPVLPNTAYYLVDVANRSECMPCVFYDKDMKYIGYGGPQSLDMSLHNLSGEIVTPATAAYMAVMVWNYDITNTFIDTACVSVSSRRNGEVDEYNEHHIALDIDDIQSAFPYGLLSVVDDGVTYTDELGEGYALQYVNYTPNADGTISGLCKMQIENAQGVFETRPKYHAINSRLYMTWRVKRGATEKVSLSSISAPFKADISYALDANDLLARPLRMKDNYTVTILGIDDRGEAFDTGKYIGKDMVDIEYESANVIPTCKAVKDAIDASIAASIPTQVAPSTPKEILTTLNLSNGVSLQPNIVYECLTGVPTARIALVVPTNNYDNVWVFRGLLSSGATLNFATNLTIKWENGIAPSFTTTQYIEIRLKRFGTTSTYLASWSAYPYN